VIPKYNWHNTNKTSILDNQLSGCLLAGGAFYSLLGSWAATKSEGTRLIVQICSCNGRHWLLSLYEQTINSCCIWHTLVLSNMTPALTHNNNNDNNGVWCRCGFTEHPGVSVQRQRLSLSAYQHRAFEHTDAPSRCRNSLLHRSLSDTSSEWNKLTNTYTLINKYYPCNCRQQFSAHHVQFWQHSSLHELQLNYTRLNVITRRPHACYATRVRVLLRWQTHHFHITVQDFLLASALQHSLVELLLWQVRSLYKDCTVSYCDSYCDFVKIPEQHNRWLHVANRAAVSR